MSELECKFTYEDIKSLLTKCSCDEHVVAVADFFDRLFFAGKGNEIQMKNKEVVELMARIAAKRAKFDKSRQSAEAPNAN